MGLYDTINLLTNGYFSTDTQITGDCSLRNDGKSILAGGLVVQGNLTATAAQTIDFSGNVPTCTGTPTNGSDLVNKTYVDSSFHPIGSYVDLTTNQTVGGVKTFTSNLVAYASTGDVFQAFKNSVVGNAGRVIINSSGDLLYFDAVTSLSKWKLDPNGLLTTTGGITASATQTINFGANVPTSSGTPTNGSDLVNKTYVDSSFHPIGSYVDLTTNQTVGGVKTFTSNLRAQATSGDVFQAFKNTGVGNAGHVLVNGSGNLLYFDSTASLTKWNLDPTGLLTTTGGITASATQTINFGSNNPTMGASNINYGSAALRVGTSGSYSQKSIAIGTTSFGTAIQSVVIGDQALNASGSTANYSVAIGVNSLALATGERNTAIGTDSLPLLTGTGNGANTAIGNLTGTKLTSGVNNLFLGLGSGAGVTSGNNNLIVGSSMFASVSPDTGTNCDNNICIGSNAMGYIKNNCSTNTAVGSYALYSELGFNGTENVAIGGNAGVRSLGSRCVFIGNEATVDVANSSYNNSTAIGYGATISASNQIKIGTSAQTTIIPGSLSAQAITSTGIIANSVTVNGGGTRLVIQTDSAFKYWSYSNNGTLTNYILNGNINYRGSINGDVETCGDITVYNGAKIPFVGTAAPDLSKLVLGKSLIGYYNLPALAYNWSIDNTTGFINTEGDIYAYTIYATTSLESGDGLIISSNTGTIVFSGANAPIRIGNSTTSSTATANNMSIGNSASSTGGNSLAIGVNTISSLNAVALGSGAEANNQQSIAVGHLAIVNGQQSVGVGEGVIASSLQGVALGAEAESTNTQVISIGYQAKGNQVNSIAIGASANANGQEGIALGFQATANFSNSVSIGKGVACTATNEFRLGNATQNILFSQTFYPYEVSPTTITGTSTIAGAPFYGMYLIATTAAGTYTITIPAITAQMVGLVLTFRRTNANAFNSTCSITCSAGNTYLPFNSITATAAGVPTAFIGGTASTGRICILNATQFGVIN
jgi:hypothetical protein